jgi:hypothetical protein
MDVDNATVDTEVDSSTAEIDSNEQAALDSLIDEGDKVNLEDSKSEEGEEGDDEWDGKTPLHKLPRWQQQQERLKKTEASLEAEKKAREEVEKKLAELQGAKPVEGQEKPREQDTEVIYKELDETFADAPAYPFKKDYETIPEMFNDFLKATVAALNHARNKYEAKETEANASTEKHINDILNKFETEQEKQLFVDFTTKFIEETKDAESETGDPLLDAYIAFRIEGGGKTQKKPDNKTSKTSKTVSGKKTTQSLDYLHTNSMDDIIEDHLGDQ